MLEGYRQSVSQRGKSHFPVSYQGSSGAGIKIRNALNPKPSCCESPAALAACGTVGMFFEAPCMLPACKQSTRRAQLSEANRTYKNTMLVDDKISSRRGPRPLSFGVRCGLSGAAMPG